MDILGGLSLGLQDRGWNQNTIARLLPFPNKPIMVFLP